VRKQSCAEPLDDAIVPRKLTWSFVLPTYRRPDVLQTCLKHLQEMNVASERMEILVYDNGSVRDSRHVIENHSGDLCVSYCLNKPGHGLGYSLCRGASEVSGDIVIELNDDALVPPDFLERITAVFDADPKIGVVGVRAIEEGYDSGGDGIGVIDSDTLEIKGNFNQETNGPIDVEHVYGFCYAYRREILECGATHDVILLAQDYSSGNRIETDHCLSARRLGYRVVYDGSIAVTHLAKPRPDMDERSLRWRHNHWRNTLYLYLKHFGPFGRKAIATRFAIHDIGLLSFIRQPNKANWLYFFTGLKARASAVWHWGKYLALPRVWKPLKENP